MSWLKKIKLLWKLNELYTTIKEAFMAEENGIKPGIKSTEFWGKIAAQIISLVSGLSGLIDPDLAVTIVAILEAAYALSRGVAKLFGKKLPELKK